MISLDLKYKQERIVQMNFQAIQKSRWNDVSALRIIVSTLGILVGFAGFEHGFFEMLQGNVTPNDFVIEAIGPGQRFWSGEQNLHLQ